MPPVLDSVFEPFHAGHVGAIGAAVERAFALDAVSDDFAAAVRARGRKRVNRALERVEGVGFTLHGHGERFVVVVPAHFTFCHGLSRRGWVTEPAGSTANLMPPRRENHL